MFCGGYGFTGSPLIMILFGGVRLAIFVLLIMMGVKMFKKYTSKSSQNSTLKTLDEMFVRGEISEEEYRLKKKILLEK